MTAQPQPSWSQSSGVLQWLRALRSSEALSRAINTLHPDATMTPAPDQSLRQGLRLLTLWLVWLLAMLFHVDLGLMPLFHGQSPEIHSQVSSAALPWLFGAMLIYFMLPLTAVVLIAYACTSVASPQRWRAWRRLHFWFSVLYSITNLPHLVADIVVPDSRLDQVVLMLAMVVFGLLINLEGWRWWRAA